MSIKENLSGIKAKITESCLKVGRDPNEVNIIAVTKYVSIETAQQAIEAGIVHIGENRDEGLLEKKEVIGDSATWHFIGSLQTRKVKNIIEEIDYIHSLDRLTLANEINKRSPKQMKCFVQVNTSGESSKHGLTPEEVVPFIQKLGEYEKIIVTGLMTMAPFTNSETEVRQCFSRLKKLQQDVQALELTYAPCLELSMGMSNDYQIAIEEGATFIRIGTSLVGNEIGG